MSRLIQGMVFLLLLTTVVLPKTSARPSQITLYGGAYLPDSFSTSWLLGASVFKPVARSWGASLDFSLARLNPSGSEKMVEAVLDSQLRSQDSYLFTGFLKVSYRISGNDRNGFALEAGPGLFMASGRSALSLSLGTKKMLSIGSRFGLSFSAGTDLFSSCLMNFAVASSGPEDSGAFLADSEEEKLSKSSWAINLYLKVGVAFLI